MRRALNGLYDAALWLAALCMLGLLAMVLLSIASREIGFFVPGTDAYAGYLMAGAGFLALAGTFKRGEHIRVTLLLGALAGRVRKGFEVWSLAAGSFLAGLFAFYSVRLAWQSRQFNDVSTGNDATPLWIPQLLMATGTVVLAIALLDELVAELRGTRQAPASDEAAHNE
jgi:TRAP-type C4-dicarboxylate transport system permease small subunit